MLRVPGCLPRVVASVGLMLGDALRLADPYMRLLGKAGSYLRLSECGGPLDDDLEGYLQVSSFCQVCTIRAACAMLTGITSMVSLQLNDGSVETLIREAALRNKLQLQTECAMDSSAAGLLAAKDLLDRIDCRSFHLCHRSVVNFVYNLGLRRAAGTSIAS
jgi:hypothetical protein